MRQRTPLYVLIRHANMRAAIARSVDANVQEDRRHASSVCVHSINRQSNRPCTLQPFGQSALRKSESGVR